MKRVLIIGNSHSAALKLGFHELTRKNYLCPLEFDFIGIKGPLFKQRNSFLVDKSIIRLPKQFKRFCSIDNAVSSNGELVVDANTYDSLVFTFSKTVLNDVHWFPRGSALNPPLFSSALIRSVLLNVIPHKDSSIFDRFSTLLEAYSGNVMHVGAPLRSEGFRRKVDPHYSIEDYSVFLNKIYAVHASISFSSCHIIPVLPPRHCLSDLVPFRTKLEYMRNGVGSSLQEVIRKDRSHANAKYGESIILEVIKTASMV